MHELDHRVASLLRAALDLEEADRHAFCERECGGDSGLLRRLQQLLDLDRSASLPMDFPVDALAANLLDAATEDEPQDMAGRRIGSYRLIEVLGRGGMGAVWLAERDDGAFQQQVALKLIRMGMDSAHVQRQFRHERNLLARLRHPNIAALIDGGLDDHGRPWFAMERVEGVPLDQWLRDSRAGLRVRLELFVKLCRAVAHAHQHLIVHRDLKPSNVLVQADGEPRLLDFGIAKLVEQEDSERTSTHHRFLTRDFAAPEQLSGEPVGTATDVYALGLILFELLTGLRYRSLTGAANEITLRPSAALSGDTDESTTPPEVSRSDLRGDLDAIVLRALAHDVARRYSGAQPLADDVQRHLDGKPIEARPDSFRYRAGKFVRRNRLASAMTLLALLALVGGLAISLWQTRRAEQMADRAERAKTFLAGVLTDADPFAPVASQGTSRGELLSRTAERIEHNFSDMPDLQIELRDIIGNALLKMGKQAEALSLRQRNADATQALYGPVSEEYGVALVNLGISQRNAGDARAATLNLERARQLLEGSGPERAADRISVLTGLAALANQRGDFDAARGFTQSVIRDRIVLHGPESPDLAMDFMNLAANAYYAERYHDAESSARRAHDMIVRLLGAEHPRLLYVDHVLGMAEVGTGHFDAGLARLEHVMERGRAIYGPDSLKLTSVQGALGSMQLLAGHAREALTTLEYVYSSSASDSWTQRATVGARLGQARFVNGDAAGAEAILQEMLDHWPSGYRPDQRLVTRAWLGAAIAQRDKASGAGIAMLRQARSELLASRWRGRSELADINMLLAGLVDAPEAAMLRREAIEVRKRVFGSDAPRSLLDNGVVARP